MPGLLPVSNDFPPHLHLTITPPPANGQPVNVLILLHGLGDTNGFFTRLGGQLALPETCCVSLRGLTPLPFELGGFHWGDDIMFDPADEGIEYDTGFAKSMKTVGQNVIEDALVKKCGYQPREIMLFGLGQGGMAALAIAASMPAELAGVVSVGGSSPTSVQPRLEKSRTPVLLLGGSSKTLVTRSVVDGLKGIYSDAEYHRWSKIGDGMPQNREEMLPVMRFFSRRLRSRKGVPQGSVQIG